MRAIRFGPNSGCVKPPVSRGFPFGRNKSDLSGVDQGAGPLRRSETGRFESASTDRVGFDGLIPGMGVE
jgi:hypothetical protein